MTTDERYLLQAIDELIEKVQKPRLHEYELMYLVERYIMLEKDYNRGYSYLNCLRTGFQSLRDYIIDHPNTTSKIKCCMFYMTMDLEEVKVWYNVTEETTHEVPNVGITTHTSSTTDLVPKFLPETITTVYNIKPNTYRYKADYYRIDCFINDKNIPDCRVARVTRLMVYDASNSGMFMKEGSFKQDKDTTNGTCYLYLPKFKATYPSYEEIDRAYDTFVSKNKDKISNTESLTPLKPVVSNTISKHIKIVLYTLISALIYILIATYYK